MTYEDALKEVEEHCFWTDECRVDSNSKNLIIEALGKQIPKKPKEKYEYVGNVGYGLNPTEYIKGYICPMCGEWIEESEHHCICGQAIDWSGI